MKKIVAFSAILCALGLTGAAVSKTKQPSPDEIQKKLDAITTVAPWPAKSAWVNYDTLSAPSPGQLIGRFAATFAEACARKTPFTSFPRDGWKSPVQGQNCKDGSLALHPELEK
jgi:hypothetical protein